MSAETYDAVVDALRAHVADEMPEQGLLTDWYAVLASVGAEMDVTSYLHVSSQAASHVHAGLLRIGVRRQDAFHDGDYDRDE